MVYLIEPNTFLLNSYSSSLDRKGLRTKSFRSVAHAIKAFEVEIPNVVVLELATPGHNGFEFLYEMLSYSDTRDVKIVINSFVRRDDIPKGIVTEGDLQIVDYLYKPFTSTDAFVEVVYAATQN